MGEFPRPAPVEGMLEAALLLLLSERPRYGYEVRAEIVREQLVAGQVSPGRLYETLANLALDGLVAALPEASPAGPNRRRYRLTASGRVLQQRWVAALAASAARLERLLARAATTAQNIDEMQGDRDMNCGRGHGCGCHGDAEGSIEEAEIGAVSQSRGIEDRLSAIEADLRRLAQQRGS